MKRFVLVGLLTGFAAAGFAQEFPRFSASVGGGFTNPVGTTASNLNEGWNAGVSAGINFASYVGANLDFGFNSMSINSGVLSDLGYGGGDARIFSATLDPIVHLLPKGPIDIYLTGGGGYYYWRQDFTQPAAVAVVGGDRFFGFYPSSVVVAADSVNKPGVDVGAGIALGRKWGGKFFAEAKYNRIFMGGYHVDYVPVTFGFGDDSRLLLRGGVIPPPVVSA